MVRAIGRNVASLIPDGATLQMGIGSIPTAVGLSLLDKHDLGIHTELFTDPVLTSGVSTIEAVHITQLRTAVNAMRAAAGQSSVWGSSGPSCCLTRLAT